MTSKLSKFTLVAAIFVASLSAAYRVEITKIEDVGSPYNGLFQIEVKDMALGRGWCYRSEEDVRNSVSSLRGLIPDVEKAVPKCNLPQVLEAKKLLESDDGGVTSENIVNASRVLKLLKDALGIIDFEPTSGDHCPGEATVVTDPWNYFADCVRELGYYVKLFVDMRAALTEEDVSDIRGLVGRAVEAISIPVLKDSLEEVKEKFTDNFLTSISEDNAAICLYVVTSLLYLELQAREFLTEEEIKRASSTENLFFKLQCKIDLCTGGEDLGLDSPFRKHKDYVIRVMKDLIEFTEPLNEEENQKELVDEDEEPLKYAIIFIRNGLDILEERGSFS